MTGLVYLSTRRPQAGQPKETIARFEIEINSCSSTSGPDILSIVMIAKATDAKGLDLASRQLRGDQNFRSTDI
jgi:hypothetical protein